MDSRTKRISNLEQQVRELTRENARLRASEERAWRERNLAVTKVRGWEATVCTEGLQMRAVRCDEWGPGEGEIVTVPVIETRRLTALLDELAQLRKAAPDPSSGG